MIAAALGTAIGNPFTFPLFFSMSFKVGQLLQDIIFPEEPDATATQEQMQNLSSGIFSIDIDRLWPIFKTTMLGALPFSIITWIVIYFIVFIFVSEFQKARGKYKTKL